MAPGELRLIGLGSMSAAGRPASARVLRSSAIAAIQASNLISMGEPHLRACLTKLAHLQPRVGQLRDVATCSPRLGRP